MPGGNVQPSIDNSEHIGPDTTGDNIHAKRSASYGWNGSSWARQGVKFEPGVHFDYVDAQQTSSTVETYVYKLGGSGGSIVRTITLTFTDSTKSNLDTVEYA